MLFRLNKSYTCLHLLLEQYDECAKWRDQQGRTPLHIAAHVDSLKCAKLLIDVASADVEVKDNQGRTPLLVAAMNSSTSVIGKNDM